MGKRQQEEADKGKGKSGIGDKSLCCLDTREITGLVAQEEIPAGSCSSLILETVAAGKGKCFLRERPRELVGILEKGAKQL